MVSALLIGDAVIMPSMVRLKRPTPEPASSDIAYLEIWRRKWHDVPFGELVDDWAG
ncbi:MAG TPA: hypothetical protein VI322_04890 [Candidatus Saccharimonadia bacterium]